MTRDILTLIDYKVDQLVQLQRFEDIFADKIKEGTVPKGTKLISMGKLRVEIYENDNSTCT